MALPEIEISQGADSSSRLFGSNVEVFEVPFPGPSWYVSDIDQERLVKSRPYEQITLEDGLVTTKREWFRKRWEEIEPIIGNEEQLRNIFKSWDLSPTELGRRLWRSAYNRYRNEEAKEFAQNYREYGDLGEEYRAVALIVGIDIANPGVTGRKLARTILAQKRRESSRYQPSRTENSPLNWNEVQAYEPGQIPDPLVIGQGRLMEGVAEAEMSENKSKNKFVKKVEAAVATGLMIVTGLVAVASAYASTPKELGVGFNFGSTELASVTAIVFFGMAALGFGRKLRLKVRAAII